MDTNEYYKYAFIDPNYIDRSIIKNKDLLEVLEVVRQRIISRRLPAGTGTISDTDLTVCVRELDEVYNTLGAVNTVTSLSDVTPIKEQVNTIANEGFMFIYPDGGPVYTQQNIETLKMRYCVTSTEG